MLVSADLNSAPAGLLRPGPGHPIYYYLVDHKERTIGRPYAGEKLPGRQKVEEEVVKALGSQGFIRTQLGGPKPQIMLMVLYGTANAATDEIPGADGGSIIYNRREMLQLVGAPKPNTAEAGNPVTEGLVNQAMQDDRLYVMLGAFDAEAMAKKEKKLLWRTRMSIDALRGDFSSALPAMLASGAPYFGGATTEPLFFDDASRRRPAVNLGPLEVLEMKADAPKPDPK